MLSFFFRCVAVAAAIFFAHSTHRTASCKRTGDPSLDGVDMRSCRGDCHVEGNRKTEMDTRGEGVGLHNGFFFEFSQPFL